MANTGSTTEPTRSVREPNIASSDPLNLRTFYRPRSIAVVGAHDTRAGLESVTSRALAHANRIGAAFYPVNPTKDEVFDIPAVADLAALPGPIDVVLILVRDAEAVVDSARDAGLDVGFFLVFANGYSELGTDAGIERERSLVRAVHRAGARLIGPNTNANAWDPLDELPGRRIGVISQSGAQGRPLTQAQELGVALSYWAPTGNEADLAAADFIEFLAKDADTAVISAYIEGFTSGKRLREAAVAAIENTTPIVVVKVGRSEVGRAMAQSHTGHLVGTDEVWDAFFEQFGIVRVDDFDELVEIGAALARCPLPTSDGVVVCSVSGGSAAHVGDLATVGGLSLPSLAPATQSLLREVIPAELNITNPVDNGGVAVLAGHGARILELCVRDEAIGVMLCPVPAPGGGLTEAVGAALVEFARTAKKPILPIWNGPSVDHPVYRELWAAGLPVFRNVRNAVGAARALLQHPARDPELREVVRLARGLPDPPGPAQPGAPLDESRSTRWLEDRGFEFAAHRTAETVADACAAADEIGYPVVLKGRGPAHKSEHGFVRTGLDGPEAVSSAAADMRSRGAEGFLIAEHVSEGIELLAGISVDPVLGPVVLIGAGGVAAEMYRDVARSVLPLTRSRAERMLASLRISPLLDGWRGAQPVDRTAVVDTLLRIAELAATGEIAELDINPLLVRADGAIGLDALVRLTTPAADVPDTQVP
ncbi:acetate--CoA ligase family protein [Nocardia carnea]|uniref:Acetate--CoA ligase family protein n=1 Tax=Nocardia carnea TaxID=37328 RepID=A0ABW7TGB9_9NOCA|nr:acetate--CoA ligase family protein [Nocardia carnea]